MNDALFAFWLRALQAAALAWTVALLLGLLAVLWPASGLWRPAAEMTLLGVSFLPGFGLLAGAVYDLWKQGDWALFLVSGSTTLRALPMLLAGRG